MEVGEREIYLSLHCHHHNDSCIKMGSDESHFNVSVGSDGQSHKTMSADHKLFEEKGESKRYLPRSFPLTSLTPNRLTFTASRGEELKALTQYGWREPSQTSCGRIRTS